MNCLCLLKELKHPENVFTYTTALLVFFGFFFLSFQSWVHEILICHFQRHQEHRSEAARSHEADSIQHPGPERRDELPQRVRRVI